MWADNIDTIIKSWYGATDKGVNFGLLLFVFENKKGGQWPPLQTEPCLF